MAKKNKTRVLILTVKQVRALAARKPKGFKWGFITHTSPHFDELTADVVLRLRGVRLYGEQILSAPLILLLDPQNTTLEELESLGLIILGMLGSEYDEHGLDEYTSSAHLVMKKLDVLNRFDRGLIYIAALHDLVIYSRFGDRNEVKDRHAVGPDVKAGHRIAKAMANRSLQVPQELMDAELFGTIRLPEDPRKALELAVGQVLSDTRRRLWLYMMDSIGFFTTVHELVVQQQLLWEKITLPGTDYQIQCPIIAADKPASDSLWAVTAARWLGGDLVFKNNQKGHVGIFPSKEFYRIRDVNELRGFDRNSVGTFDDKQRRFDEGSLVLDYRKESDLKLVHVKITPDMRPVTDALRVQECKDENRKCTLTRDQRRKGQVAGSNWVSLPSGINLYGSDQAGEYQGPCPTSFTKCIALTAQNIGYRVWAQWEYDDQWERGSRQLRPRQVEADLLNRPMITAKTDVAPSLQHLLTR